MRRWIVIALVLATAAAVTCFGLPLLVGVLGLAVSEETRSPEEVAFSEANRAITSYQGDGRTAFGNNREALTLASDVSSALKAAREGVVAQGNEPTVSLTDGEFLTYCRLNPDSVVFLIHVPQLRKYEDSAKRSMAELAWHAARRVVEDHGFDDEIETLAVATRGDMLYDEILIGRPAGEPPAKSPGSRDVLHRFFTQPLPMMTGAAATRPASDEP